MQYDVIAVDVFNYFYRKKSTSLEKDAIGIAHSVICGILDDIMPHLAKNGRIYLLYDPIPKSDLGIDKMYKYTGRQEILKSYKSNREHNAKVLMTVHYIYKYFLHRGPQFVSVISNMYEADDYVESIISEHAGKQILMVTTDNDWCRYLSDSVAMMNSSWENIFTVDAFEKKYEFIPSIAGVCVWKACFGDGATVDSNKRVKASAGSDNIKGALVIKGLKNANIVKLAAFNYVKWLGYNKRNVKDILQVEHNLFSFINKERRNPEEEFFFQMECLNKRYNVTSAFFMNLNVIMSRCDDYKKYAVSKDIDEKYNKVIDKLLGFNVKGSQDKSFKFGLIKG